MLLHPKVDTSPIKSIPPFFSCYQVRAIVSHYPPCQRIIGIGIGWISIVLVCSYFVDVWFVKETVYLTRKAILTALLFTALDFNDGMALSLYCRCWIAAIETWNMVQRLNYSIFSPSLKCTAFYKQLVAKLFMVDCLLLVNLQSEPFMALILVALLINCLSLSCLSHIHQPSSHVYLTTVHQLIFIIQWFRWYLLYHVFITMVIIYSHWGGFDFVMLWLQYTYTIRHYTAKCVFYLIMKW